MSIDFKPRPYQEAAVNEVEKAFFTDRCNNQVIQLPTGTGKTEVFAMFPDRLQIGDRRMIVQVHRDELVQQAYEKLKRRNPEYSIGVEKAEQTSGPAQIVVASVPTLSRSAGRLEKFKPEDVAILVTDECHHATADSYLKVFDHFKTKERSDILNIGVTATTNRADGKGLNKVYDRIVYEMSIYEAIRQGWLSNLVGVRVRTDTDISEVAKTMGDFSTKDLSVINNPARNHLIAREYTAKCPDRKFIGFAVDIAHAKDMAKVFKEFGHSVEAIWGNDPDRALKLKMHREGKLHGLFNCELLTEGYDDWTIKCIIMARPTTSSSLYTQMLGRGTRIPAGLNNLVEARMAGIEILKEDCMVLDIVDVSRKHSLANLPSLFGMGDNLDLKGKSILEVFPEIEEIRATKPLVDLSLLEDITKLKAFVEDIDFFKVDAPPECVQLSEFRWFRTPKGNYYLSLMHGEVVFVIQDFIGNWHITGNVNKHKIDQPAESFEAAIKEADYRVRILGGKLYKNMAKRILEGISKRGAAKPTEPMLWYARRLGLTVPPGVTKGALRDMISQEAAKRKWKTMNRKEGANVGF